MKTIMKKWFSMVEVALAIGILAVGAVTVITLFPVGMKQAKDSMGQNYSAIFADDVYAYISSLAKDSALWDDKGIIGLPSRDKIFLNGSDTPSFIVSAMPALENKISGRDNMYSTSNKGVYVVAKGTSSRSDQDYSAQVLIWQGKPYSQDEKVIAYKPPPVPETPKFNISSGTVSNTAPVNVSFKCLGVYMQPANPNVTVSVTATKIDGTPLTKPDGTAFIANPPGPLTQSSYNWTPSGENAPVGTSIVVSAKSDQYDTDKKGKYNPGTVLSTDSNQVWVLKNGDPVPTIDAYGTQLPLSTVVKDYVTNDGKIKLADNQVIYGFELYTKDKKSSAYDMQDLVLVATLAPTDTSALKTSESGIGINPTNSDYAFDMTKSDGTHLTRDDLKKNSDSTAGTYSANSLVLRTKSGDEANLALNGENVLIDGKNVVMNAASNGSLKIKLWKAGSSGGIGNWYIQMLEGSNGNVTVDGGTPVTPPSGATTTSTSEKTVGVGVNVEISWPLHQTDYSKRNKLRYYFEVYDLNSIGAS